MTITMKPVGSDARAREFVGSTIMRMGRMLVLLTIGLAGCSTPQGPQGGSGGFVSAVGTPFLIAMKIPVCVTSIAIGGPIAGASALTQPTAEEITLYHNPDPPLQLRRDINDSLIANCGPPYIIAP
jgi:hypothetical protein